MNEFKNFNVEDISPYFKHLVGDILNHLESLRTGYGQSLAQGYLDPDSHENLAALLKASLKLNDEIYALGRVEARARNREHCLPMRGEKAAIERLRRFTRGNSQSAGLLRFLSPATESGEAE